MREPTGRSNAPAHDPAAVLPYSAGVDRSRLGVRILVLISVCYLCFTVCTLMVVIRADTIVENPELSWGVRAALGVENGVEDWFLFAGGVCCVFCVALAGKKHRRARTCTRVCLVIVVALLALMLASRAILVHNSPIVTNIAPFQRTASFRFDADSLMFDCFHGLPIAILVVVLFLTPAGEPTLRLLDDSGKSRVYHGP